MKKVSMLELGPLRVLLVSKFNGGDPFSMGEIDGVWLELFDEYR
jgi:hypothetical protein